MAAELIRIFLSYHKQDSNSDPLKAGRHNVLISNYSATTKLERNCWKLPIRHPGSEKCARLGSKRGRGGREIG